MVLDRKPSRMIRAAFFSLRWKLEKADREVGFLNIYPPVNIQCIHCPMKIPHNFQSHTLAPPTKRQG